MFVFVFGGGVGLYGGVVGLYGGGVGLYGGVVGSVEGVVGLVEGVVGLVGGGGGLLVVSVDVIPSILFPKKGTTNIPNINKSINSLRSILYNLYSEKIIL